MPGFEQCRSVIAGEWRNPAGATFYAWDPVNNCALGECASCTDVDVDDALTRAQLAAAELAAKTGAEIAGFLRTVADRIEALGDTLIHTCTRETALPEARLLGERGRTCGQLRAFADLVAEGSWRQACIDTAEPGRTPLPKPDLRAMLTPVGPVIVFAASNFPFAFGSIGGDTASALAAGNPVLVKAHPGHPATATLFAEAMNQAIRACDFPAGAFSLLQGNGNELGGRLVAHPLAAAVGFTGSLAGGRALMDIAAARPEPIPVYAEMGSINPVFILPDALHNRADEIAAGLGASVAMGVGQFCTSPGLIVTMAGSFAERLAGALAGQPGGVMLNPGIAGALNKAMRQRLDDGDIALVTGGPGAEGSLRAKGTLMKTGAAHFVASPALQEEVFGPVTLLVECESASQMGEVAAHLSGNLTATIHTDDYRQPEVTSLLEQLRRVAGRVLFNGYPTGVEVCPAMHHGGPWPASSAAAATSVGTASITRFCRRNALQNCPDSLLPAALQNANPLNIWRLVNGEFTRAAVDTAD